MNTFLTVILAVIALAILVGIVVAWVRGYLGPYVVASNVVPGTVARHPGIVTRRLEAALTARRLLVRKGTADDQILIGTAAAKPLGVVDDIGAIGDRVSTRLLGVLPETEIVIANGAIGVDVDVFAAAGGKVSLLPGDAGTYWKVGRTLTPAGADDDEIEIITCEPVAVVVSG